MENKNILLVEDDKFISRAYKEGLTSAGFNVEIAFDGEEGLKAVEANRPDLILLDIIMPIKNGFEMLEDLRKGEIYRNVPVIILSNLGQESDIEKGKLLGATDFLVKADYSMEDVINKVKENLNIK